MDLVALRLVTAETEEDDFAKSLFSLVKHNNGYWKSDKQGRFLLKGLVSLSRTIHSSNDYKDAHAWASRQGVDLDTAVVFPYKRLLEQYGRVETKRRYAGWFFLVDESGVLAVAKVKVDHKPKDVQREIPGTGTDYQFDFMPETAAISFKRPAGEPPIKVPFFAETKAAEADRERRKTENEGLINTLKNVADYRDNSFLQDMVYQLEQGRILSPKQMQVVNKFLPKKEQRVLDIGKPVEWLAALEAFYSLVETKVLPSYIKMLNDVDRSKLEEDKLKEEQGILYYKWDPHNASTKVPAVWGRYKSGVDSREDFWHMQKIIIALDEVLHANVKDIYTQDRMWQLRDLVLAAVKSKTKLSKVRLDAVLTITKLADKLSTASPAAFAAHFEKN
jgi:uncharacterized protein YifE (UPF0438 family)